MNLLLLEPAEIAAHGQAVLTGRRAKHAHEVLRAAPGKELRVGIVDGPLGTAEVQRSEPDLLELHCAFATSVEERPEDVLLLAIPRPRVLSRCLEDAAALGYGRIVLVRTWRVDKSWLASHALAPDSVREHLMLGLEQARRTRLPAVTVFPLFRPFVEDRLEEQVTATQRFVAHPTAAEPLTPERLAAGAPFTLAIGPEGGFVPFEIETLCARGFEEITLGPHPQRVGVALAALTAQVQLLRAMPARS